MKILLSAVVASDPHHLEALAQDCLQSPPDCLLLLSNSDAGEQPYKETLTKIATDTAIFFPVIPAPEEGFADSLSQLRESYAGAEIVADRNLDLQDFPVLAAALAQPAAVTLTKQTAPEAPEAPEAAPAEVPAEPAIDLEAEKFAAQTALARELATAYVRAYDYAAAQTVVDSLPDALPAKFKALLRAVTLRSTGQTAAAQQMFKAMGQEALMPAAQPVTEYFLRIDLLRRRGHFGSFLRATADFLPELLMAALRKQFQFEVRNYLTPGTMLWNENKLVIEQLHGKFSETSTYHTRPRMGKAGGHVTAQHLSNLMENLAGKTSPGKLISDTLQIRADADTKLRSLRLRAGVAVTAEEIGQTCGRTPEGILNELRQYATLYTDLNMSAETLATYDKLNELLLTTIGSTDGQ